MVTITNGVLILEGITITGESPDLPLISGTNNNTLQKSSNGLAITNNGNAYQSLQNLPSIVNNLDTATDINTGDSLSWNLQEAGNVYMIRNTTWNAVDTTGWALQSEGNYVTGQSSGTTQLYSKTYTPGIYAFDNDSAIYMFSYNLGYSAPTEEVDANTEINIYFDSSGSMDSTLSPLQTMRTNDLRTALEPFYNNDSDAYNSAVTVHEVSSERVFDMMKTSGSSNSVTRVINLVFSDENSPYGASNNYPTDRTAQYNTDMAALRSTISAYNTANTSSYYRSVLYQVNTGPNSYPGYKQFTQAVYNGTGNYSGTNGLSDFTSGGSLAQTVLYNDVIPAANSTYYANQIISGLNAMGYDLDLLSYS